MEHTWRHGRVFVVSSLERKKKKERKDMAESFAEDGDYKLRGRKLILEWGKMKIEISKLPYLDGKDKLMFDLCGSGVVLANVLEGPDGKLVDEILGPLAGCNGHVEGYDIKQYLVDDSFWMTPGEAHHSSSSSSP